MEFSSKKSIRSRNFTYLMLEELSHRNIPVSSEASSTACQLISEVVELLRCLESQKGVDGKFYNSHTLPGLWKEDVRAIANKCLSFEAWDGINWRAFYRDGAEYAMSLHSEITVESNR